MEKHSLTTSNVTIINEDVLKLDLAALANEKNGGKPIKVVANLPYYITTPIIMGLFESHVPVEQYHGFGAKGSGDADAGRTRHEGLWGIVARSTVLCRTIYCCQCAAELLYSAA